MINKMITDNDRFIIIAIAFLAIIAVVFIFLYFITSIAKLSPSQCSGKTGVYGVTPNKTGTIKKICGNNNNDFCSFDAIDLFDATLICDIHPECDAFIYSCDLTQMSFINRSKPFLDSNTNLYQRNAVSIVITTN